MAVRAPNLDRFGSFVSGDLTAAGSKSRVYDHPPHPALY
jgi:hypothetical protein